jgi:mannosyltransferase
VRAAREASLLPLALVLGLVLRLYDLGAESIWVDEVDSIHWARLGLRELLAELSQSVHPPLYFVILHYWVALFGDSEFSVRLPSVVFGVLALPMIYKVGELLFGKRVGAFSALILATSLFHISWSQEARGYSLVALLALASMYFFIRLRENGRLILRVGYVLASSLLAYTHYYGLFVLAAQTAYVCMISALSERRPRIGAAGWFMLQGAVAALYLPWAPRLLRQFLTVQAGYWIPTPTLRSVIGSFLEYCGYSRALLLCFLGLTASGLVALSRARGKFSGRAVLDSVESYAWTLRPASVRENVLVLLWLAVPIAVPFALSRISAPIYYTRYTIAASLAFYILAARGLERIGNSAVRFLALMLILAASLTSVRDYYVEPAKREWREAANYLDRIAKPGDLLLFNDGGESSLFAYYSRRSDLSVQGFDLETRLVTERSRPGDPVGIDRLELTVRGHSRVWLLLANSNDQDGLITKRLSERYRLAGRNAAHHGIEILLFEREGAAHGDAGS